MVDHKLLQSTQFLSGSVLFYSIRLSCPLSRQHSNHDEGNHNLWKHYPIDNSIWNHIIVI